LFAGALWGLVVGARDGRAAGWIGYAAAAAMLMYAHGLAPLFVVVLAALFPVIAPRVRRWSDWRPWLLANAAVALAFAPYAFIYARRASDVAAAFWVRPQGPEPPILTTLFQWTVVPIPPLSQILARQVGVDIGPLFGQWVWFAPVLLVLALAIARVPPERRWVRSSLLLAYVLPILVLSALNLVIRPLLIPRVLLPTVVPTVLLLGSLAASGAARRAWRHLGLGVVFVVLLAGTLYHFRYGTKEEWRRASQYLQESAQPTDVVVFNVGPPTRTPAGAIEEQGRFLVNRYDERRVLARVPQVLVPELTAGCASDELPRCLGQRLRAYPSGQVVWLVQSHARPATGVWLAAHLDVQDTLRLRGIDLVRASVKP
jgi:4-amino-4-deoxy-L-arabinose transferase-like glycosyltransferase